MVIGIHPLFSRVYGISRHYCPIFANDLKCLQSYKTLLITVLICFFFSHELSIGSFHKTRKLGRCKTSLLLWLKGKEVVKV
jgi:hypothetical protein